MINLILVIDWEDGPVTHRSFKADTEMKALTKILKHFTKDYPYVEADELLAANTPRKLHTLICDHFAEAFNEILIGTVSKYKPGK